MENEPRKASDILLELESKIDQVLSIMQTQDLNIKILSNKLNTALDLLAKTQSKITVEAVNTAPVYRNAEPSDRAIPIFADNNLMVDNKPQNGRRTSREVGPESNAEEFVKFPVQIPNMPVKHVDKDVADIIVPKQTFKKQIAKEPVVKEDIAHNFIPVSQRVVNGAGKSLFMAEVEIIDANSMNQVFKGRTSSNGKWSAALAVGDYRVFVRKLDSISKEKIECKQDFSIDGFKTPFELTSIVIKK